MSYKGEFLTKIREINNSITGLDKFNHEINQKINDFVVKIKELGTYSAIEWNLHWRKEIYIFGKYFEEKNPSFVFNIIDTAIENTKKEAEIEVLEFIRSEIYLNFFTIDESLTFLLELSNKYPLNPEFKKSVANCYNEKGDKKLSNEYFRQALKIEPRSDWQDVLYNQEYSYAENLIKDKNHEQANKYLTELIESEYYKKNYSHETHNFFIFLRQRNDDQILIEKKLEQIQAKSNETISKLFEKSRIRVIEILGFFMAIIAFVFGSITIIVKTDLTSSIILISSFGLMMLVFVLALSIVFVRNMTPFYKDKRFIALLIIFFINFSLIFLCTPLKELFEAIIK